MTAEQFTYWLNGFVELNGGVPPTAAQWASIAAHLKTVFHKVTPPVGAPVYPPGVRAPNLFDQIKADEVRVIC